MTMMRAAVWLGDGVIEPTMIAVPDVPDGWALVRVSVTGLCGTDLSILHGSHPRAAPPLVMGHEIAGRVELSRSPLVAAGDLVMVEPLISCGLCWACTHGEPHVCRRLGLYGIDAPGGLAEYIAVPATALLVLPPGTDPVTAALLEPLSVAVHAVSCSGTVPGDTVLVFGGGPIGVLTGLVAMDAGAGRVAMVEPNASRASLAAELGFRLLTGDGVRDDIRAITDGEGADVTFDTAGHPSVVPLLPECTRVRGTIVIVGVHKHPVPVDLRHLNFAEQRMQGVRVYTRGDVEQAIALAGSGRLGLERLRVRVFPLGEVAAAFAAAERGDGTLKTMVSPGS